MFTPPWVEGFVWPGLGCFGRIWFLETSLFDPQNMCELTPLEALSRLWHRKYWVLATVFTCLLLSGFYLKRAEQLFDVQANLLLELNSHGLRLDKDDNARPNAELIATQSEILASRQLLRRAVAAQQERAAAKSLMGATGRPTRR